MSERITATIHAWDNGRGLTRDLKIIVELLEQAGYDVTLQPVKPHQRGAFHLARLRRLVRRPTRDLNLFLERLVPSEFHRARYNVLIPNQEWFPPTDLRLLPLIDLVACRSRLATELFADRGPRVEWVGFTSLDRHVAGVPKSDRILHIAGQSQFKGTAALIRVWERHPEWPRLTLVHRPEVTPISSAANVQQLTEFVADDQLMQMQQEAWLQVQPSEAEGFGHCLCEGMSSGSMVLAVDAAPMNELIGADRGVLVPWSRTEPMGIDHRYLVDEARLDDVLAQTIAAGPPAAGEKMAAARAWYSANDARFRQQFATVLDRLIRGDRR